MELKFENGWNFLIMDGENVYPFKPGTFICQAEFISSDRVEFFTPTSQVLTADELAELMVRCKNDNLAGIPNWYNTPEGKPYLDMKLEHYSQKFNKKFQQI